MVMRVLAYSVILAVCLSTLVIYEAAAGVPQPFCGPAPGPCCPPRCGPPSPFLLCGSALNCCSGICGATLQLPALFMAGLLAPPPCRPACSPRATCAPAQYCPPPQRVTKCKPVAACPPASCPSQTCAAPMVPRGCPPPVRPVLGCGAACAQLAQMPFRLVNGLLSITTPPQYGCFSDKGTTSGKPVFGCLW